MLGCGLTSGQCKLAIWGARRSWKPITDSIFHRKLMVQALLLFSSQHMRRAFSAQEWMRKQNHGSCYSKHRLWWLISSDSFSSFLLPLLVVKRADDSAVQEHFSKTFFSSLLFFFPLSTHTCQSVYLVGRKNCYSNFYSSKVMLSAGDRKLE